MRPKCWIILGGYRGNLENIANLLGNQILSCKIRALFRVEFPHCHVALVKLCIPQIHCWIMIFPLNASLSYFS